MVKVYAFVLALGAVLLIAWIVARVFGANTGRSSLDPETRFGVGGRRVVAAMVGFGMGGMSAEFSPLGIPWPVALVLALVGAGAAAWFAGWEAGEEPEPG